MPDVYRYFLCCGVGRLLARLSHIKWANEERVGEIEVPILFIAGSIDPITPPIMSYELSSLAVKSSRKKVYEIIGGKHNGLYKQDPNFWLLVDSFLVDSETSE